MPGVRPNDQARSSSAASDSAPAAGRVFDRCRVKDIISTLRNSTPYVKRTIGACGKESTGIRTGSLPQSERCIRLLGRRLCRCHGREHLLAGWRVIASTAILSGGFANAPPC